MKYKYIPSSKSSNNLNLAKTSKKHKCKKLLNSKCLVAGLITVVGSMMMAAQSDAQTEYDYVGGNANWGITGADVEWDSNNDATADTEWDLNGNNPLVNPAIAIFEAIGGGNVTVVDSINVSRINLTSGYNILDGAGDIMLLPFLAGPAEINSASNAFPLISESLAGGAVTFGLYDGAVTGTVELSGANTFTGVATIGSGLVLQASSTAALGTVAGGTVVESGGTLQLDGVGTGDALTLSGTGASALLGALDFVNSSTATITGNITLDGGGDVRITANGPSPGNNLIISGDIDGGGENLVFDIDRAPVDTSVNVIVTGNIGSGVNDVVLSEFSNTSGAFTASSLGLIGTNTYTGDTLIRAGRVFIGGGDAIPDDSAVVLTSNGPGGPTQLNFDGPSGDDETIGSLSGDVPSSVDLRGNTLTTGGNDASTEMAGVISDDLFGAATGSLTKEGIGTFTLSNANTYGGQTSVEVGILHITNGAALGDTGVNPANTVVSDNAQLQLSGGITVGEEIHASGDGPGAPGTGAILSNGGDNTLTGLVFIQGVTRIGNEVAGTTLTIQNDIDVSTSEIAEAGQDDLWLGGAGDIVLDSGTDAEIDDTQGGNRVDDLVKYGTGTVDLRGGDHDHDGENIIREGVLLIDSRFNLGDGNLALPGSLEHGVTFTDSTNTSSELRVDATGGDVTLASGGATDDTRFAFVGTGGAPVVGTINVLGANTVFTEFGEQGGNYGPGYTSNNAENILRKDGPGELEIDLDGSDLTAVALPGAQSVCEAALFAPNTVDFAGQAGGTGLIVDPAAGTLLFDNAAQGAGGRATITLNGIGNLTDPALSTGTLELRNLNLVVNQVVPTFFGGSIVTDGAFGVNGTNLTLTGPQPGIAGQIVVINGGTLTIGDYGSLGSNGDYTTNGTYVCGDGTLALNALTGTAPLNERITLFNDANLVNNEGDNTIASEIFLHHDPLDRPNPSGAHTARIAALDGTLTLTGGIDAHDTPGDMNLGLNTALMDPMAPDITGTVNVKSEIEATVVDLDIGNNLDTSVAAVVNLNSATGNSYTGVTRIHGGIVLVGHDNSFSTSNVFVTGNSTLHGKGRSLSNTIDIASGATLSVKSYDTTNGDITLTNVVSGAGGITVEGDDPQGSKLTLLGDSTYSGETNVNAFGELNVNGTIDSLVINVEDGTLNTIGDESLDDASTVTVNGSAGPPAVGLWNLGGNETINILDGDIDGVVDVNTFNLTTSSGNFLGNVTNSHGQYHKVGAGTQVLGGNVTFLGGIHVVNGVLNLGSNVGANTTRTSFIDVDAAGSLILNDTDQLKNGAAIATAITTDLNIAGNLTMEGGTTDEVENFTLSGSFTRAGAGNAMLTSVNGYDLNNGASTAAGANLGNGEVRANGNVALAGNVDTLEVQSGVTTLTGDTGGDVNVLAAANLVLNGSDIDDGADLQNQGTITITGSDTIDNYTSSGGTLVAAGAANLTATGGFILLDGSTVAADITGDAVTSGNVQLANTITGNLSVLTGGTTSQFGNVSNNVEVANGATLDSDGNIGGTLTNAGTAATSGTVGSVVNSGTLTHDGDITATLTNSGSVTLAVDDTITGAYTSNGGTLNGGGQTLTAASYALNDGSVVNANLGTGAATADGIVAINGDVAGALSVNSGVTTQAAGSTIDSVTTLAGSTFNNNGIVTNALTNAGTSNVAGTVGSLGNTGIADVTGAVLGTTNNSGTLTNTGTLTGNVTNSGTMTSDTDGIADTATLTNSGTLTIDGTDTVASFTQSGGTYNGGTLTAATNTLSGGTINGDLAGPAVTVNGTVALNGQLTNGSVAVDIDSGNLTTGSDERINNSGSVNVDAGGTLTLGGQETIQSLTGAGSVVNGGNNLIVDDNGTNSTFSGIISGAGDLIKEGNGTLTLTVANTFTGTTHVADGALTVNGATLASSLVQVDLGGTLNLDGATLAVDSLLQVDGTVNLTGDSTVWDIVGGTTGVINLGANTLNLHGIDFDGTITGTGGVSVASGNLVLDGNSTYVGTTMITGAGTEVFLNGSIDSANVTVGAGASLVLGNNHGSHIVDTATLVIGGTLNVSPAGETVAQLDVNGGTVNGPGTLSAGTYNLTNATILSDLGLGTLNQAGGTSTLHGDSAASVVNVNTGTLNLNGELTSGILNLTIANGATLATGGAERINDNATVAVNGDLDLGGDETFRTLNGAATGEIANNGNMLTVSGGTYAGNITGAGALNKNGAGTLSLTSAVDYSGATNVNAGTLSVAGINNSLVVNVANGATLTTTGNEQLANTGTLNANGTVNLGGNETINILNGSVTGLVNNNGNDLTLNSGSFGGSITGAGDLNKNSNGTLALTGDNSMTGQLDINGGTVELSGTIASGSVDVANNATLNLNGDERLANNANVNVSGDLNLGGTETVASLTASGDIGGTGTLDAATYQLNGATTGANANLGDGALTTTGATTINGNSAADTVHVDSGSLALNGQLTNGSVVVTIDGGTTLTTGGDERINDGGTVNANGTLDLGGDETITTLNGSGTVDLNTHSLTVSDGLFTGTMTNDHGDLNVTAGAPGGMVFDNATGTFTGPTHVLGGGLLTLQNGTTFASSEIEIDGFGTMNITDSEIGASGNPVNINVNLDGTLNLDGAVIAGSSANPSNLNIDGTLNVNGDSSVWDVTGSNTGVINLNNASVLNLNGIDFDGMVNGNGSINAASGTVDLGGNSNFTGDLTVQSGATVELEGTVTGAANVNVNPGGTLVLMSPERINDSATLNANGLLTLNGLETIAQLNAGGTINGNGTLRLQDVGAGTFELTNGAVVSSGVELGDGTLNTNGLVELNGNKAGGNDALADTTNVQSGILNVHGTITDPDGLNVNVSAGATLQLHHDERIGNNAVLTSNGTVNLDGTETVTTFNLNGPGSTLGLTPGAPEPSLLIAETYNLGNGATTLTNANMGEGILNIVDIAPNAPVTLNGTSDAALVNINPNTTLNLGAAERLNDMATVNNNGTLNIFDTETIGIYNSTGTLGLAPGAPDPSCLIADVYNLNGGTIINAGVKLGGGVVNIGCDLPGVVTINGNVAAEDVTLCANSVLNLNGEFTNIGTSVTNPGDNFTIVATSTLNLGSDERINDNAAVINDGTFNLNGVETIGTFTSSGTLGGAGTLIGTGNTINLINGHTSLNGTTIQDFSGTSSVNPSVTSNGTVTINGTAGSQSIAQNGRINTDFLTIQSGTMNLNGLLIGNPNVTINSGATLESGSADRVSNSAVVTIDNGGVWNLAGDDTIGTFFAGGQLNNQPDTLTASSYNLTGGADINANLGTGVLNSNNSVLNLVNTLDGDAEVNDANITSGTLNLNGELTAVNTVDISNGATVNLGSAERIANGATVNNFGELDLNGNEMVTTYNSNGGFLDNSGTLTAATYNLANGASTDFGANLGTGTLNTFDVNPPAGLDPAVVLNGNTNANFINIATNTTLSTNGAVQNAAGVITVSPNGSWDVNNTNFTYNRLQGNGGRINALSLPGDLFVNQNTVAPGMANGQIGTLQFFGSYREQGTLEIEFRPGASDFGNHDRITISSGLATLDANSSVLDLESVSGFSANNIQCGERFNVISSSGTIQVVNASATVNGWSSIGGSTMLETQTWGNKVLFDRGTGDVVGTGLAVGQSNADIAGINNNQLAVIDAITTQAIDTVGNYNSDDFGAGNVLDNILRAADVGGTAGKLSALDSLMPTGYAGAVDYAINATRGYTESAMRVTPFGGSEATVSHDEKGNMVGSTDGGEHNYQVFGGYHSLKIGSDSSRSGQDYDLQSDGGFAGVRAKAGDKLTYGAFLGIDKGSVDSGALNLDSDGTVIGAFAHYQANEKTTLWANLSYGSFELGGDRGVFGSRLNVENFDADAFELGFGVDYQAYSNNGFSVTPGIGLRFIDASTDNINETGGPAALTIDGIDAESFLLDLRVNFAYTPEGQRYGLNGYIGYQHDFENGERDIDAMLTSGSPYFSVTAPGLGDSAFTYGIGGFYNITDDLRVDLNYRGESRSDADDSHGVDLRFSYGF